LRFLNQRVDGDWGVLERTALDVDRVERVPHHDSEEEAQDVRVGELQPIHHHVLDVSGAREEEVLLNSLFY
jgi:hypothetical protein